MTSGLHSSRLAAEARRDFPQIGELVRGKPLTYLDSAATSLKPRSVIEILNRYYSHEVANIHRGAHYLGSEGTSRFEEAREKVANFILASSSEEIVFTRGTTEAINLVATVLERANRLKRGQKILLTAMEHHSNIVPWQILSERVGLTLEFVNLTPDGQLDLDDYRRKLTGEVGLVAMIHASNVLGVINPVAEMVKLAAERGALTLVDAAQSASLGLIKVPFINADFVAFSGHKIFGPTGIGVLYGRKELLNALPPYQGGGAMIQEVLDDRSTYLPSPQRFEAGTPHIAGVLGLAAAIDYVQSFNLEQVFYHERELALNAREGLLALGDIRAFSPATDSAAIVSFTLNGAHPSDVAQILDQQGVAVRSGHLCCQPLMRRLGVTGVVRASFSIYSSSEDVEILLQAMKKAKEILL